MAKVDYLVFERNQFKMKNEYADKATLKLASITLRASLHKSNASAKVNERRPISQEIRMAAEREDPN